MLNDKMLDLYEELRIIWRHDPVLYAKQRLGMSPTWQQMEIINAVSKFGSKVTVRSGHGTGKSASICCIIFWMLECINSPRIPMTAPSSNTLRDVIFAELAKWRSNSDEISRALNLPEELWLGNLFRMTQDRVMSVVSPNQIFAVARTARPENPTALAGFHQSSIRISDDGRSIVEEGEGGELLFIIEESAGVDDKIFEVASGALSSKGSRLLMVGNPTKVDGFFARSHKQDRASYTCLHFRSSDSPLVEDKYHEELVRKFGEGSNVVRVRSLGEFPLADDDVLIGLDLTEPCLLREAYPDEHLPKVLGVDVARFGSDRTVFVLRQGRNVLDIAVHAKDDTMTTAGRIIKYIKERGAQFINVDEIGLGAGVVDRLKELVKELELNNVYVQGVGGADKSDDRTIFDSNDAQPLRFRDSLWLRAQIFFRDEKPSLILAPKDHAEDLVGELSTTKYRIDSSGRLVMESKDEMKRRGLRSPDIGDAMNLTLATNVAGIWSRL